MSDDERVADYDPIAARFDRRYTHYSYDGVRETLLNFVGNRPSSVLDVGCGTGHWLAIAAAARTSADGATLREPRGWPELSRIPKAAGLDTSAAMLVQARGAVAGALLVRAGAEALPFADASFDRLFCINALHHFRDRARFFADARRVLRPGGGLLTIGMDPHTDRDEWWVYDYFEPTRTIDRERFARVRTLRGEMALAGFAWTESMEADHIEIVRPATEALADGTVDRSFTSQLTVLTDEEFSRGAERLRRANDAAAGGLQLVADIRLYATTGWV